MNVNVMMRALLFELHGPDSQVWRLYADGRCEGFPEGTLMVNRALILINALASKLREIDSVSDSALGALQSDVQTEAVGLTVES